MKTNERPIARWIVCLAVVLLGLAAVPQLDLRYIPSQSFPELSLSLTLPENQEIEALTDRWIVPLEASIRSVGDVSSTVGRLYGRGGQFTVRFRAGVDPDRKAGRLEAELAGLRRELPEGARIDVRPAGTGGDDRAAVIWLETSDGPLDRGLLDALLALPEVRSVLVAGEESRELRLRARAGVDRRRVEEALRGGGERLGRFAGAEQTERAVFTERRDLRFADEIPFHTDDGRLISLASAVDADLEPVPAPFEVRLQGSSGKVLSIYREIGVSSLALERSVSDALQRFDVPFRFLFNEAEPLRRLLDRLLIGLIAAVLWLFAATWRLRGFSAALRTAALLPVGLALTLIACVALGISLNLSTLPMFAIGLGGALLLAGLPNSPRIAGAYVLAALLFPVAVALAGDRLAEMYLAPARAFVLAAAAGAAANLLVPPSRLHGLPPPRLARRLRDSLRSPFTAVLAFAVAAGLLFVLFKSVLLPEPVRLQPAPSDLHVSLRFADGTTLKDARRQAIMAEETIRERSEIDDFWVFLNDRGAQFYVTVGKDHKSSSNLQRIAGDLQMRLRAFGASSRVSILGAASGGGSGRGDALRLTDSLEDRAEISEGIRSYRFILRSTDLEDLRVAQGRIRERLTAAKFGTELQTYDWGRPTPQIEVAPRLDVSPEQATRAAAELTRRALRPMPRPQPGDSNTALLVLDARSPASADTVISRTDLQVPSADASGAILPESTLLFRRTLQTPWIKRQAGRYVLPITIRLRGSVLPIRDSDRKWAQRTLKGMSLPASCALELPEANPFAFSPERKRLAAVAGTLPLLLWAFAAVRLNSLLTATLALFPGLFGFLAVLPWIRAAGEQVDEMMLFAVAAAAAASVVVPLETAAAATPRQGFAKDLRELSPYLLGLTITAIGAAILLASPGLGLAGERTPWALPLRSAAAFLLASAAASFFAVPACRRAALWLSRGPERIERRRATRRAWEAPGTLVLEAQNLTKVYDNGFTALRGVDFRVEPGIVGLLGPNGAGKTTLLRLLCGLHEASRGRVLFRDVEIDPDNLYEYRRMIGFLPQDFNAYEGFTGEQFLDYWALEKGLLDPVLRREEIEKRIVQVGLEEAAARSVRQYSGGMRRRIGIARALLGDPPIVIVDEPTTGLDVQSRNQLRESLLRVAGERIILFSTHIASDIAAAAGRILVLDQGRLLYDGGSAGLIEKARGAVFETLVDDDALRALSREYRITARVRTVEGIRVRAVHLGDAAPPGEIVEPNLEEAYLAIMGEIGVPGAGSSAAGLLDLQA